MTTFCLVHGAFHGAWCWEKLIPELERRGFACVAPELPSEDPAAGVSRYADVVVAALDGVEDDVVLVAHSLAALTIPIVASRRPVAHLVFVCAPLPVPGVSLLDEPIGRERRAELGLRVVDNGDGTRSWPADAALELFFHDCSPEDARWAAANLRPQALRPSIEPWPLERWPEVESTSILCRDDRVVDPEYSRRVSLERLGKPAVELPGGHSPMISRPRALTDALVATWSVLGLD